MTGAAEPSRASAEIGSSAEVADAVRLSGDAAAALRNVHMMHVLERVVAAFERAGVPVMLLKGAALQLLLYAKPDERPMGDLDLLIRPEDVGRADRVLVELGARRGEPLVREDFFPRYYYETEYELGELVPIKIDLHVRPFRPLRYARMVPEDALWADAEPIKVGRANAMVPRAEDMLIHLAVHAAVHGFVRSAWLAEMDRWVQARRDALDWDRLADKAERWRLTLPIREAIARMEARFGACCPKPIRQRLAGQRVSWADRLALWQAPRDDDHLAAHVLVNVLVTPGWRFRLGYLWSVSVPDEAHMANWYSYRHVGWRTCAHAVRLVWPMLRRLPGADRFNGKVEVKPSSIHGMGVFATRVIQSGERIGRFHGLATDRLGPYTIGLREPTGEVRRYEMTGPLRYLNHSTQPNGRLAGFELIALRPIMIGEEVTIDYRGDEASSADVRAEAAEPASEHGVAVHAA